MRHLTVPFIFSLVVAWSAAADAQIDFTSEIEMINTDCDRADNPLVINQDNYVELQDAGVEIGFIIPNAVDAVVSMCNVGRGLNERREYDVDIVRQAIRENLNEIRFELQDLSDDRPAFSFADGVWTIGVAPTTTGAFDQWYYYYLGFNADMPTNGFPLAEAREHALAWAHVDESKAAADAACGVEFEVEMDWAVWTGDVFNLPWVEPFDAVINNHFGPDLLGEHCSNILDAFTQECGASDGEAAIAFAEKYHTIRCLPDPMGPQWNDPYEPPTDYETGSPPEGAALWELNESAGTLAFYFWAGSWNTGRATEVLIDESGANTPPRCVDLPETCEFLTGGGTTNNTANNSSGTNNSTGGATNVGGDEPASDGCATVNDAGRHAILLLIVPLLVRRRRRTAGK